LKLAWELEDRVAELRIYESLAISHYYFGDVERCNYYLDRFTRGKYELT